MIDSVELFPGFPLPSHDYAPLLGELAALDLSTPVRVAHSLGSR